MDIVSEEEFIQRWGLNENAQGMLTNLMPDVKVDVMNLFQPRDLSRDVSSLFISFARSRAAGKKRGPCPDDFAQQYMIAPQHRPQGAPMDLLTFCTTWNLDEASQTLLLQLPQMVQTDVIMTFHPRDKSRDPNPIFMAYAKSRAAKLGIGIDASGQSEGLVQTVPSQGGRGSDFHVQTNALNPRLEPFVQKWNLNETTKRVLLDAPPDSLNDIISTFSPHDTDRDVNAVCVAYVRSRTCVKGKGKGNGISDVAVQQKQYNAMMQMNPMAAANLALQHQQMTLPSFLKMWSLNDESRVFMERLAPPVQLKLMNDFHPRDTARDANRCFMSFVRSRAVQIFTDSWGLSQVCVDKLKSMTQSVRESVMQNFQPRDLTHDLTAVFLSFCKSRENQMNVDGGDRGVKRKLDPLESFAEEWNLSNNNREALRNAEPMIQQDVMNTFRPRDASRDVNAVFASFLRSREGIARVDNTHEGTE